MNFWLKWHSMKSLGLTFIWQQSHEGTSCHHLECISSRHSCHHSFIHSYLQPAPFVNCHDLPGPCRLSLWFHIPGGRHKPWWRTSLQLKNINYFLSIFKHCETIKPKENETHFIMLSFQSIVGCILSLEKKLLSFLTVILFGYFVQTLIRAGSNPPNSRALR